MIELYEAIAVECCLRYPSLQIFSKEYKFDYLLKHVALLLLTHICTYKLQRHRFSYIIAKPLFTALQSWFNMSPYLSWNNSSIEARLGWLIVKFSNFFQSKLIIYYA